MQIVTPAKFINIFVFFVFILDDVFAFWFHKDGEITKKRLNFGEILCEGTKRAVPGGQYHSISPARAANQNAEFATLHARSRSLLYNTPINYMHHHFA